MNYKKNRNSSQEIIGVLNESINLFTIDAPDVVSKPTVNVSGMANAGGTVTLLVNEKEQQTVQVSKAGLWSAVLTLENPSNYETYKIKALCTQQMVQQKQELPQLLIMKENPQSSPSKCTIMSMTK